MDCKKLYQQILECLGFIITKYELSTLKNDAEPVFSKWCGENWTSVFFKTCLWPQPLYPHSRRCFGGQKFINFTQNLYEGLIFSHVKFNYNLSADLKQFPRKPQNFGDNWALASISPNPNKIIPIWLNHLDWYKRIVKHWNIYINKCERKCIWSLMLFLDMVHVGSIACACTIVYRKHIWKPILYLY